MIYSNPFIKLYEGLSVRWSELDSSRNLYLEAKWNKGESVHCLCQKDGIEMKVGKKNDNFYLFNTDKEGHVEDCPLAHLGKAGEYRFKNQLSNLQLKLESILISMGSYYWNPRFIGKRNRRWFKTKFKENFKDDLLFYPDFGNEDTHKKNESDLDTLIKLCGGEFYIGGFLYEIFKSDSFKGSYIKLKGFDKKFNVNNDVVAILNNFNKEFDFFCLIKMIVKKNGFVVGVDGAGIFIEKKTLTPHYWRKRNVEQERVFKCLLFSNKANPKSDEAETL